jgi:hypothetical protein
MRANGHQAHDFHAGGIVMPSPTACFDPCAPHDHTRIVSPLQHNVTCGGAALGVASRTGRIRMRHRTLIALAAVAGALAADAGTGYGQVMLVNQTGQVLDLYVDDHYGCRAMAGLTCSTMERAGAHTLYARAADGQSTSMPMELDDGGTFTYTISEE